MAFTKITAAGIGSTETVTLDGLSVINDGSFGGNVSVGGTLTYEDVTNIDSVGLITARAGVVVGSGITLSVDGDGFFTGVVTATTFKGDGSQLTGVNSDVVDDTTPQLGGNLDTNDKNIVFGDSSGATVNRITFGAGTDLKIYHDGSNSYIDSEVGSLIFRDTGEVEKFRIYGSGTQFNDNVILANDDDKIQIGASQDLELYHDGSHSYLKDNGTGNLKIVSNGTAVQIESSTGENMVVCRTDGAVELYHDNTKQVETSSSGLTLPSGKGIVFPDGTQSYPAKLVTAQQFLYPAIENYSTSSNTPQSMFDTDGHTLTVKSSTSSILVYLEIYGYNSTDGMDRNFEIQYKVNSGSYTYFGYNSNEASGNGKAFSSNFRSGGKTLGYQVNFQFLIPNDWSDGDVITFKVLTVGEQTFHLNQGSQSGSGRFGRGVTRLIQMEVA